ncbi:MAG TPA: hypothetical protein VMP03_06125 [Methylomirabilota bacterium]|nr:hypothetical protein [Methylomirabilota bacterium]
MPRSRSGTAYEILQDDPAAKAAAPVLSADVADRLEAMRRHLTAARPTSGNEALRLLRTAFPFAPLAERVRAADGIDRFRF